MPTYPSERVAQCCLLVERLDHAFGDLTDTETEELARFLTDNYDEDRLNIAISKLGVIVSIMLGFVAAKQQVPSKGETH